MKDRVARQLIKKLFKKCQQLEEALRLTQTELGSQVKAVWDCDILQVLTIEESIALQEAE